MRNRLHDTSSQSDSTPSCPPGKTSKAVSRAMREPSRLITGVAPSQMPEVSEPITVFLETALFHDDHLLVCLF